jgi:hypothetical protein
MNGLHLPFVLPLGKISQQELLPFFESKDPIDARMTETKAMKLHRLRFQGHRVDGMNVIE